MIVQEFLHTTKSTFYTSHRLYLFNDINDKAGLNVLSNTIGQIIWNDDELMKNKVLRK